ncbi:MAG: acyltransferase family protein [Nocardioides sp.]
MRDGSGVEVVARRRDDIQGLRALAVGLVVAAHLGVAGMSGGFIGVDVFFVISGFLITGVLLREHGTEDGISVRGFFTRRAQRILPAAIVVSASILAVAGLTQSSVQVRQYLHDALWSAGFLENKHLVDQATDYFATNATSPFQHFWSLSVEEQFYLAWPLALLLLLRALSRRAVLVVIAVSIALSVLASVSLTLSSPDQAYFATYTRAFELGLGALLALGVVLGGWRVPGWFAWVGGVVGLTLIVVSALVMDGAGFPGWRALVPTLGATALLAAGLHRQVGVNRLLGIRPLRWLGDISYGLYLWHFPIIVLGRPLLPEQWSGWQQALVLVATSLLAADLTYRLIERPLLRRRHTRFRGLRPLVWWPVAFATVATVAFGSSAYATHRQDQAQANAAGWYEQHAGLCPLSPTAASATPTLAGIGRELSCSHQFAGIGAPIPPGTSPAAIAADGFKTGTYCWAEPDLEIEACPDAVDRTRPTIAVLGDSHLGQWLPALQRIARARGENLVPFVRVGCPVWDLPTEAGGVDGSSPACAAYRTQSRQAIIDLHPDVLLVASITDVGVGDGGSGNALSWRKAISSAMPELARLAPKVMLLSDNPLRETMSVPSDPDCLGTPGFALADCEYSLPGAFIRSAHWVRDAATSAGIGTVDTVPLICAGPFCPGVADGIGTYSDESHVSRTWSLHVSTALDGLLDDAGAFSG